jgi:hypothetical protein
MSAHCNPAELERYVSDLLDVPVATVRAVARTFLFRAAEVLAADGVVHLPSLGRLSTVVYAGRGPASSSIYADRPRTSRRMVAGVIKTEVRISKGLHLRELLRENRARFPAALQRADKRRNHF